MKAKLVLDLDEQPAGIQLLPESPEELNIIRSLAKAKFNKPTVIKKSNYDFETKVEIQVLISRSAV